MADATETPIEASTEKPMEIAKTSDATATKTTTYDWLFPSELPASFFLITDMKIGTFMIFISAVLYFASTCYNVNVQASFGTISREEAKVVQHTVDFIFSIFHMFGSFLLIHLSWFDGWKMVYAQLRTFDPKKEPFWNRYFWPNRLVVAVWLLWLPNIITFFFPCWALYQFNTSGIPPNVYNYSSTIVSELVLCAIALWLTFFWVYACFPELMRKNDNYGSVTFLYYLTVIGPFYLAFTCFGCENKDQFEPVSQSDSKIPAEGEGEGEKSATAIAADVGGKVVQFSRNFATACIANPFEGFGVCVQRPIFGADFTVGAGLFAASSFIGVIIAAIDFQNYFTGYGLFVTILYFVGAIWIWQAAYPYRMAQNDFVGCTYTRDFFVFIFTGCGMCKSVTRPWYKATPPVAQTSIRFSQDENSKF